MHELEQDLCQIGCLENGFKNLLNQGRWDYIQLSLFEAHPCVSFAWGSLGYRYVFSGAALSN